MKRNNRDWIENISNYIGDTLQNVGSDNPSTRKGN